MFKSMQMLNKQMIVRNAINPAMRYQMIMPVPMRTFYYPDAHHLHLN